MFVQELQGCEVENRKACREVIIQKLPANANGEAIIHPSKCDNKKIILDRFMEELYTVSESLHDAKLRDFISTMNH